MEMKTIIRISQALLAIAMGIAGYLAYQALTGSQVAGCGPSEGCGKVLASKWSSIFTIPVSLPGIAMYLGLLLTLPKASQNQNIAKISLVLAFSIIFGALWFTGLQVFLIKSYCVYCCTTHAIASVASLLAIKVIAFPSRVQKTNGKKMGRKEVARKVKSGKLKPEVLVSPPKVLIPLLVGLGTVCFGVALQAVGPEKNRSAVVALPATLEDSKTVSAGQQNLLSLFKSTPKGSFQIGYEGGKYSIEDGILQTFTLGQKEEGKEPILLTYLFDWTCDHCRAFHKELHKLSSEESPLGLKDYYVISLLPASYESTSEVLHRILLTTYYDKPELYNTLEEGLYSGRLDPQFNPVLNEIRETYSQDQWSALVGKYSNQVVKAVNLAKLQGAYNEAKLGLQTFPQLTGVNSVITGVPSKKALKSFLKEAAAAQQNYLMSTAGVEVAKPTPITRQVKVQQNTNTTGYLVNGIPKRNQSKIEFKQKEFRLDIQSGEIASQEYTYTNTGTEPLEVYAYKTGCSCKYVTDWKKTIQPGEEGTFTLHYNSKGKEAYGVKFISAWITTSASNYNTDDSYGKRMGNKVMMKVGIVDDKGRAIIKDKKGVIRVK